jgi:hypothetical protein
MKKVILVITIILASTNLFSQSFDGISISGDLPTIVSKFKTKGYQFDKYTENGSAIMKGKIAGIYNVELYIFVTPKTKKVCKVVGYLDKEQTWYNLKNEYEKFVQILTEKYGPADNTYNTFTSPYYEGDGYEMTAIGLEKCIYASIWLHKSNLNLALEISKYKQVKFTYENDENMKIMTSEIAEMQNKSF